MKIKEQRKIICLTIAVFFAIGGVGCAERGAAGVEGYVSAFPPSCSSYIDYVSDDKKYGELIGWADANIFNRSFADEDFTVGWVSGPGKKRSAIDLRKVGISGPNWIENAVYEVRAISEDLSNFNVIYIGGGKYRGVLIARKSARDIDENSRLNGVKLKMVRGRTAVVCHEGPG